jgi:hypothetical protein
MEKLCIPSGMDMACATRKRNFAKTTFNLVLMVFLTFLSLEGQAQTPLDANLSISNNTGIFSLVIPDSTNISEIELIIGTKANLSDVFAYTYTFDQNSGLPSGLAFNRVGMITYLGIGIITIQNVYNSKVRLKNTSGTWGDWYEIISN